MGNRRNFLRAGGVFAVLLPWAGCVMRSSSPPPPAAGGPPAQAPAHGYRRRHRYHYYPDSGIYLDLDRRVYFHLDGGTWKMSASLPAGVVLGAAAAVEIEMDTDTPYIDHHVHKSKYPPGQAKKDAPPGQGGGKGKDKNKNK